MTFSSLSDRVRYFQCPTRKSRTTSEYNIPLISGNYGLRNHFWPLENRFLMRKSEKKLIFSKPPHCMFLPLVYSFGRWWQLPKEVLQNEGGSKVFGIFLKIHLYCHKRFPKTSQIIKDIHHQHNQVLSWHLQKTQSYHSGLDVMDWVIESVT